jgi:hypothetical protein
MAPYNVFHWSLTHQNAVIDGHLATYRGIFVGDACGANARLERRSGGRITHANCNTHARREFVKAERNDPVLASQAISLYRQLYEVEERGKTLDAAARRELRQRDAVPIWNRMRRWLDSDATRRVLPKSAIGEAFGYLRNQWSALGPRLIRSPCAKSVSRRTRRFPTQSAGGAPEPAYRPVQPRRLATSSPGLPASQSPAPRSPPVCAPCLSRALSKELRVILAVATYRPLSSLSGRMPAASTAASRFFCRPVHSMPLDCVLLRPLIGSFH